MESSLSKKENKRLKTLISIYWSRIPIEELEALLERYKNKSKNGLVIQSCNFNGQ